MLWRGRAQRVIMRTADKLEEGIPGMVRKYGLRMTDIA